jgi:pimeloyl-ACP methyl ester carboxylesterase
LRRTDVEVAGEALSAVSELVRGMHEGIAARPFDALGSAATPVRVIHDAITGAVYGVLRGAIRLACRGGTAICARSGADQGVSFESTAAGLIALAAINGVWGDHLHRRASAFAFGMTVRRGACDVALTPDGLATVFPDATARLVVFVHGLGETDQSWSHFPLGGDRACRHSYGEQLQDELGYTPVFVRYNCGRHVSDNGRDLARALRNLVAHWPVKVVEIVLVGHSMGGLIARSACRYGEEDRDEWTHNVRRVVCLGTPHLGADLEKGLNVLGWALGRFRETRALGSFVNARSAGIKDLRYGSCSEEDWRDRDPDELLRDRCHEVPFLPNVDYHFVAARIAEGPLGSILGDLLVRVPSASGRSSRPRRVAFAIDNGYEPNGLTHFDLLNDPAVYKQLRAWITRPPRAVPLLAD